LARSWAKRPSHAHARARPACSGPARLAEWRQAKGRSQESVAEKLGWLQTQVSRFERRHDVQVRTLQNYCRALGAELELHARSANGDCWVLELAPVATAKRKAQKRKAKA
jgi:transcriptional regulator with XRE-family HTH domain